MDLNVDGKVDILSGSYSRMDKDMAGLFQVLWGTGDGSFESAAVLNGTDGKPLIIATSGGKRDVTTKICTRPTAVDLNGDGKLDIVTGNFTGTFAVFEGLGKGRFAAVSTMLMVNRAPLRVKGHSDPFFVDWDADGDLDLISGSAQGGVFLCTNNGSAKEPQFGVAIPLVTAIGYRSDGIEMGDAHRLKGCAGQCRDRDGHDPHPAGSLAKPVANLCRPIWVIEPVAQIGRRLQRNTPEQTSRGQASGVI